MLHYFEGTEEDLTADEDEFWRMCEERRFRGGVDDDETWEDRQEKRAGVLEDVWRTRVKRGSKREADQHETWEEREEIEGKPC